MGLMKNNKLRREFKYLSEFPFLENSEFVLNNLNISVQKIDGSNVFDSILLEIYTDICTLLKLGLLNYDSKDPTFEVTKFYLTIIILQALDNMAVTKIWIDHFISKTKFNIQDRLLSATGKNDNIIFFLDIFRLLNPDSYFRLRKITLDNKYNVFGIPLLEYLDVAATIQNSDGERYQKLKFSNCTVHKGMVIIGYHETEHLSAFIEMFAKLRFYDLYNSKNEFGTLSGKLTMLVNNLKKVILESNKISINIKKHHINKELLYQQQKIKDVEQSNVIIKEIIDNNQTNVHQFPPCVNVLLDKIFIKRQQLSHNENILLCTYLAKKQFAKEQIIKIFSQAVNYDPKVTSYQISSLVDKEMMPMSCNNLETEGLCYKQLDKTAQCKRIKNPLSFR